MTFPSNPTNGQVANVNGIQYTYNSSIPAWTVTTNTGGNLSGTNITAVNNISGAAINSTGSISAQGNISGNYILGNGALLTGVSGSSANINNGTSNVTVVSSGGNVTVGVGGTSNVAEFATTGLRVTGVVSVTGNVTGNYILGNGALLTGVITSVANINNGTSNVTVVSSGGNITVGVGGTSNVAVFANTGQFVTGAVSATGNITGNYIFGNGSQLTGISTGTGPVLINEDTVTANLTIGAGQNGFSVGPMTTANGVQITVADGQRWIIL